MASIEIAVTDISIAIKAIKLFEGWVWGSLTAGVAPVRYVAMMRDAASEGKVCTASVAIDGLGRYCKPASD